MSWQHSQQNQEYEIFWKHLGIAPPAMAKILLNRRFETSHHLFEIANKSLQNVCAKPEQVILVWPCQFHAKPMVPSATAQPWPTIIHERFLSNCRKLQCAW